MNSLAHALRSPSSLEPHAEPVAAIARSEDKSVGERILGAFTAKKIDMMGLNPDGSWSGGDELPAPGGPRGLAIGDFNGDGVKDIAAALDAGGANVWLGKEP